MRSRRRRISVPFFLFLCAASTGVRLLLLTLRSVPSAADFPLHRRDSPSGSGDSVLLSEVPKKGPKSCATVEEMGKAFQGKGVWSESLRVRELIQRHFDLNGASRVRELPPEQFCRHGFIIGKASEAGFGNEMYKLLTAAALSVMLNRSLIIGQTRHIGVNTPSGITFRTPILRSP